MLDAGEVACAEELGKRVDVDASYVRRLLKLACLAPTVVEAVLDGCSPDGLSLATLTADLPLDWRTQAEKLGL
jgi:ParB-like chromosome segregation protein Spo0J